MRGEAGWVMDDQDTMGLDSSMATIAYLQSKIRELRVENARLVAALNAAGDLIDIVYKETPDELEKFKVYEQALAALDADAV